MGKSKTASLDNFRHNNNEVNNIVIPICDHGAATGRTLDYLQHVPGRYYWSYEYNRFGQRVAIPGIGDYGKRGVCNCGMRASNIAIMWHMYERYGRVNTDFVNKNEVVNTTYDTSTMPSPPPRLLKWNCDPSNNYYAWEHNYEARVEPFDKKRTKSKRQSRLIFPEDI